MGLASLRPCDRTSLPGTGHLHGVTWDGVELLGVGGLGCCTNIWGQVVDLVLCVPYHCGVTADVCDIADGVR